MSQQNQNKDHEFAQAFFKLSLGGQIAFVYKKYGEEVLVYLLRHQKNDREGLEDAAEELEQLGLTKQAKVVRDFAKTALSRFDESPCPYWDNPNYKHELNMWLERNEKAKKKYLEKKAGK